LSLVVVFTLNKAICFPAPKLPCSPPDVKRRIGARTGKITLNNMPKKNRVLLDRISDQKPFFGYGHIAQQQGKQAIFHRRGREVSRVDGCAGNGFVEVRTNHRRRYQSLGCRSVRDAVARDQRFLEEIC
jgi:NADH dehydrogenase/NADH:ubiquinone oxidoreductase subunit G